MAGVSNDAKAHTEKYHVKEPNFFFHKLERHTQVIDAMEAKTHHGCHKAHGRVMLGIAVMSGCLLEIGGTHCFG